MTDLVLVLTTVPDELTGEKIGRSLVEAGLIACASVLPPMISIYRWQGAAERTEERQLVMKTTAALAERARARAADLHPYEVPEWLVVPVLDASPAYAAWVRAETDESGTSRTR